MRFQQSRIEGAILVTTIKGVKRDVGRFVLTFRFCCRPVKSWIEQESALQRFPFDPGMGSRIVHATLANDDADMVGTASQQLLVKRDRLALAISHPVGDHFGRRFPLLEIPVRHGAQPKHPFVENEERSLARSWTGVDV